ncbi:MAG: DUF882 domain-containing protein [Bacteroidota bacterium]
MVKKLLKRLSIFLAIVLIGFLAFFFFYANSLSNVNPIAITYYQTLKKNLKANGYKADVFVISGKRANWHNQLLTYFGAASKSQHLKGNAIDIVVLDVNDDGLYNDKDVDIVTSQLELIIRNKGGVGTYKTENLLWNRQMVHFDCRGSHARWSR